MNKDEAEDLVNQLRASSEPTPEGDEDFEEWAAIQVGVDSFNEGKHHCVVLKFKGQLGALEPHDARGIAEDLLAAANEAEELNNTD
ncbi:hypothetical protein [Mycolicibacterium tusciae]|uniref:hypothetical protein n=1 Tax=Mycolicibacterium tusciae TaxID=75922 RepID=UPI00024A2A91|nr:hypothetical protein [Mycolicibacterium tusciae]